MPDEYIKRSDAILRVANVPIGNWSSARYVNEIIAIPAADVAEVRHGYNVKASYSSLFECSLCGWACNDTYPGDTATYQYCPNCGAKLLNKEDFDAVSRN